MAQPYDAETAERLGRSESAVKSLVGRGLRELAGRLGTQA